MGIKRNPQDKNIIYSHLQKIIFSLFEEKLSISNS